MNAGLVLSTAYLAWSFGAQAYARSVAQEAAAAQGPVTRLLVTPTPFNTILWRVVAMRPDGSYDEGFLSLFDGGRPLRLDRFGATQVPQAARALPGAQRLAAFSQGFTSVQTRDGQAWVTDLRMGQEPNYTFSFLVGRRQGGVWVAVTPRNQGSRGDVRAGLAWIWNRMWGAELPPPRSAGTG